MLPKLILTTNKQSISNQRIFLRQSEKGLVLPVQILDDSSSPFDLTSDSIRFKEAKIDGKLLSDMNVEVTDAANGIINYTMHSQAYAANGSGWFEILKADGTVIESTQDFKIEVLNDLIPIDNATYLSDLEQLSAQMGSIVDEAKNTEIPSLNSAVSAASAKVDQLKQDLGQVDWQQYVKSINGRKPDSSGNATVPMYAPNLLTGTGNIASWPMTGVSAPEIVQIGGESFRFIHAYAGNDIEVPFALQANTKYSLSFLASSNNDNDVDSEAEVSLNYASDSTPILLTDALPNKNTYKKYISTFTTPTKFTALESPYITARYINLNGSLYLSQLKLAIWSDLNTPPDMTWVPNTADTLASAQNYTDSQIATLKAYIDSKLNS